MALTVLTASDTFRLTTMDPVMDEVVLGEGIILTESLIDQASAAVARYCGRIFAQQAYREVQGGWYQTSCFLLRQTPIVSVSSVTHGSTTVTDYRIEDADVGALYYRDGWYLPRGSDEEWTIDYLAGYRLPGQTLPTAPPAPLVPDLPDDIERATIEAIKVWFHERYVKERIQSKTFGLTGDVVNYGVQALSRALPRCRRICCAIGAG